jgi:hypothetical protein
VRTSDLIIGCLFMFGGAVVYLTNFRRADREGKIRARIGLALEVVGVLIAFGAWIINQIFLGK